jgi:hypothetical protein
LSLPPAERGDAVVGGTAPSPAAGAQAAAPVPATGAAAAPGPSEELVTLPPQETGDAQPPVGAANAAGTTYKLLIKPWGTVYVNGVERGVSPPLKRLVLPAGEHTIRLVNPSFPDRVITLASGKRRSGKITHNFASRSN